VTGDLTQDQSRLALVQWARRMLAVALNQGVAFIVAAPEDQGNAAKGVLSATDKAGRALVLPADAEQVAQACLRHDPEAFADANVRISSSGALSSEMELLLRRAFHGFDKLTLVSLSGGRSSADGVWRVEAEAADRELRSPFVVKCGPFNTISRDIGTYRDVVADRIPFRGCAPICIERSLAGATRRLAVSRFVENARRLDEVLLDPTCPNVDELIARVFTGPLHRWRVAQRRREVSLFRQFLPRDADKDYLAGLKVRHQKFKKGERERLLAPEEIFAKLKSLPRQLTPIVRAHDDLNIRNVFVTNGTREIVLIDFTRAIQRPLSRDVARLDVGLAFDEELNQRQPIQASVLMDFFSHDLFAISLPRVVEGRPSQARIAALQGLRHHILVESHAVMYDPALEYKVAVITELMYQAQRAGRYAAIAYRCIDALARSLPTATPAQVAA
jgi:hypothetical protein